MKRELCCADCAKGWKRAISPNYPGLNDEGEGSRHVAGEVAVMGCICDGCGKQLPIRSPAVAVSLYSASRPYFAWEGDYLEGLSP